MEDSAKYLIHATITADGVVERSDVVGAIFGQTEGLLGDDLDLRDLQQSSKVGRIDVEVDSEAGRSTGEVTIATSLDRVETAILAASLETITRVGPCQSTLEVTEIEDVREAKRREIVDRAKELLTEQFDDTVMSSSEIMDEVREAVRVADITEYRGLPAGPRVADSDAIIVVEGRADVLQLLRCGVKNAIAVEGTDVPDAVADLTQHRTVTAFLDGDRGGELILQELLQVGDVDHVAFAPEGKSVEDLSRAEVMTALREKVPLSSLPTEGNIRAAISGGGSGNVKAGPPKATETSGTPQASDGEPAAPSADTATDTAAGRLSDRAAADASDADATSDAAGAEGATTNGEPRAADEAVADGAAPAGDTAAASAGDVDGDETSVADDAAANRTDRGSAGGAEPDAVAASDAEATPDVSTGEASDADEPSGDGSAESVDAGGEQSDGTAASTGDGTAESAGDEAVPGTDAPESGPSSLGAHVRSVIDGEAGTVRLLDGSFELREETGVDGAFEAIRDAEDAPFAVVLDGELTQRILDVAAQRGVEHVVSRSTGEFVKRPVDVRVRTAEQLAAG